MRHTHLTGDVYLNDVSLYEVDDLNQVYAPTAIKSVRDPQGTTAVWYATVDGKSTTIYARFGKCDPNKETVEIAARPTCFYPTQQGLNYITIRGFHVSQAATQWGSADSRADRDDCHTLVQGLDHRGQRHQELAMQWHQPGEGKEQRT
jgi:hypothetical protein